MKIDAGNFTFCPFCGKKLNVAEEDGMFDGKGSKFCPNCGLINRKPTNKSSSSRTDRP